MTIVTTAGSATANSYISAADATTAIATLYDDDDIDTAWAAHITAGEEEAILTFAASLINEMKLKGYKASENQALEFPRYWLTDFLRPKYAGQYALYASIPIASAGVDNMFGSPPAIPTDIKNAQAAIVVDIVMDYLANADDDFPYLHATLSQSDFKASIVEKLDAIKRKYLKFWVK